MISFEEFKAEYKELVELQFAVAGAVAPNTYTMVVEFENMEDSQGGKHKRDLDVHNSFATEFPTTFSLYETNITFLISLRGEKEGEILNRFMISTSEILLEKEFTLCKDLKVNGLYLYARFLMPENTYPMYNLTISAQNLPLLTGLFGECDPFLRILKKNINFGTYMMVYESEVHRNTSTPSFKPIKVSLQRLCGGRIPAYQRRPLQRNKGADLGLLQARRPLHRRRVQNEPEQPALTKQEQHADQAALGRRYEEPWNRHDQRVVPNDRPFFHREN